MFVIEQLDYREELGLFSWFKRTINHVVTWVNRGKEVYNTGKSIYDFVRRFISWF